MAWNFGDGFDCYAATADMDDGYWDSSVSVGLFAFVSPGRFTGSQCLAFAGNGISFTKSSGVNDAVHHFTAAFKQTAAISGSTLGGYLQLRDGATAQCSIVFRSDGAILLTSGAPTGTVLATYAGAFPVTNTWYHFEFEVVINATTGSFKVRKDGNSTEDHSTTGINTQVSANAYANSLRMGGQSLVSGQLVDDLFWQSSSAAGAWLGDIRCITRMPASDASVAFSRSTGATNFSCVDEVLQNAATDYVYSSTAGQEDFYGIASIASTPATVIATTVRAYALKSDAGTRTLAAQVKSGGTTVASSTLTLTTSGWQWAWRTDLVDPATSVAWTAAGVSAAQIGPRVVA